MPRVGEYIWDGKYDDVGNRRRVSIADVDCTPVALERNGETGGRSILMRGDALGACAALARDGITIDCCYIDPPFDVGHSFAMAGEGPTAYGDSWGTSQRSYVHMMYERCSLIRDVLSEDGCLLVHCDWRVSHQLRMMLDEVFGEENFRNEIIWSYRSGGASRKKSLPRKHDTILLYSKTAAFTIRPLTERQYLGKAFMGSKIDEAGRHYVDTLLRDVIEGAPTVLDEQGSPETVNCRPVLNVSADRLGYPTQKPRGLLELLIRATTDPGDVVADFFCGSGTTLEAAAHMGRMFVGADLGGHGFRTSRARLLRMGAAFNMVDLGVTRRKGELGIGDDALLSGFGAKESERGVWRLDGVRCEVGLERATRCGESEVVALLDRDCVAVRERLAGVNAAGMRIRPVMVPREFFDPCECEDMRWVGPVTLEARVDRVGTRVKVELQGARMGEKLVGAQEFVDSWAIDPEWAGVGSMSPSWRSQSGIKGEAPIFEAEFESSSSDAAFGILVVDVHGNVHRALVAVGAECGARVPIIPA